MIQASKKTAVLTITEKLNTVLKMKIASVSEVNYVITEEEPTSTKLKPYKESFPSLTVI